MLYDQYCSNRNLSDYCREKKTSTTIGIIILVITQEFIRSIFCITRVGFYMELAYAQQFHHLHT